MHCASAYIGGNQRTFKMELVHVANACQRPFSRERASRHGCVGSKRLGWEEIKKALVR